MSELQNIKHIVVVGHHLPLMVTAAILSSQLKDQPVRISVLEIKAEPASQIECSGSEFLSLCEWLKLPTKQLMQQCQATFSVGQQYTQHEQKWFLPFGHYGIQTQASEFIQGIFRLEQLDSTLRLETVSIAAQAAKLNKFAIPPAQRADLHEALRFAAHLPVDRYAVYLKQFASSYNVDFIQTQSIDVVRDSGGKIQSVCLDANRELSADFWIDCSGDMAVLAAANNPIEPLTLWDNKVECFVPQNNSPDQPYSSIQACPFGWLKGIPVAEKVYYQLEYNSHTANQAEVELWLNSALPVRPQEFRHSHLSLGVRQLAWQQNCLLLGNAALNLGSLCFSELHFVQAALMQFLALYPSINNQAICAAGFNKNWQQFVLEASEYVECHAWLWRHQNLVTDVPEEAVFKARVELFLRCGRMLAAETDALDDNRWYGLLDGIGIRPQQCSLYLSNLSDEQLSHTLTQVRLSIDKLVAGMPAYQDFYQQFNRAKVD